MNKKNKKKGFTLVELIAVIAIIGILAAVLLPKVTGYITEAKKIEVIDEARKVVTAAKSIELKTGTTLAGTTKISEVATKSGGMLDTSDLTKIDDTKTLGDCINILDTENYTFTIDKTTKKLTTVTKITP